MACLLLTNGKDWFCWINIAVVVWQEERDGEAAQLSRTLRKVKSRHQETSPAWVYQCSWAFKQISTTMWLNPTFAKWLANKERLGQKRQKSSGRKTCQLKQPAWEVFGERQQLIPFPSCLSSHARQMCNMSWGFKQPVKILQRFVLFCKWSCQSLGMLVPWTGMWLLGASFGPFGRFLLGPNFLSGKMWLGRECFEWKGVCNWIPNYVCSKVYKYKCKYKYKYSWMEYFWMVYRTA